MQGALTVLGVFVFATLAVLACGERLRAKQTDTPEVDLPQPRTGYQLIDETGGQTLNRVALLRFENDEVICYQLNAPGSAALECAWKVLE